MIDHRVTNHLERYSRLARNFYAERDYALATFFAITTIEEASKILIVKGSGLVEKMDQEVRREALSHKTKLFSAVINLLDQSVRFEALPSEWKGQVQSWFDSSQLDLLRKHCLYLRFTRTGGFITPAQAVNLKTSGLLVYLAGFGVAALYEFIEGLDNEWADSIFEASEQFRRRYLDK